MHFQDDESDPLKQIERIILTEGTKQNQKRKVIQIEKSNATEADVYRRVEAIQVTSAPS